MEGLVKGLTLGVGGFGAMWANQMLKRDVRARGLGPRWMLAVDGAGAVAGALVAIVGSGHVQWAGQGALGLSVGRLTLTLRGEPLSRGEPGRCYLPDVFCVEGSKHG